MNKLTPVLSDRNEISYNSGYLALKEVLKDQKGWKFLKGSNVANFKAGNIVADLFAIPPGIIDSPFKFSFELKIVINKKLISIISVSKEMPFNDVPYTTKKHIALLRKFLKFVQVSEKRTLIPLSNVLSIF